MATTKMVVMETTTDIPKEATLLTGKTTKIEKN